jgi:23S rRNA (cytosine1962-C5)-methyltransferase
LTAPAQNAAELTRKGYRWARTRHPWVYADDIASVSGANGDVVRVTFEGRVLGTAFLGTRSKIALRWIERSETPREPDPSFWRERMRLAMEERSWLGKLTDAFRMVHDAADGIPGLVADRYGPVVVLQATIAGTERILPVFTEAAADLAGARTVILRNDVAIREREGLPRETKVAAGEAKERVWVHEVGPLGRIEYPVEPLTGQKTGAFLDQRENRWEAARRARGRVLDAFSYQGLFALHCARSADAVVAVETSEPAIRLCEDAARRNGFSNVEVVRRNVFDYLKDAVEAGERFNLVVLDPPAFAKSRADLPAAERGYREINRRAMSLLEPGGTLVTCSCSYNLSEVAFLDILREAAADARVDFRVVERRTQASDHPVILNHPESSYLKCVILERKT